MKINELFIESFRHIENSTIEFGKRLTLIAGQNGTGKSSLLGWVAQLCKYRGMEKRFNGKPYREDYSNIFKFCPDFDYKRVYKVYFHFTNENGERDSKSITTRYVKKTSSSPERYRTDFDQRGSALNFPIIYLGLKRLVPIATEKKVIEKKSTLIKKYENEFSRLSKEILILIDSKVSPQPVSSRNKELLAMKTENYSYYGNSAGQDNIGQIISSILSFEKLKDDLGENYRGGLLLIDELDATLYAGSQIKLVEKLFGFANKLNLQIVFTSHSLELIEYLSEKLGDDNKINFLNISDAKVKNLVNPSFDYIKNKIKVEIGKSKNIARKQFICEDIIAQNWCSNLLNGTDLKKILEIKKGPFGDGDIINLAQSKHNLFKDVGFVLDGDIKNKGIDNKKLKKTVFLPGEERPESIFYKFVKGLSDEDEFWDDENNFTKQTCFKNYPNESKGMVKRWMTDDENKKYFGKGYSKLLNRWKKENKELVSDFLNDLRQKV